jgi:hypothetical protein
MDQTLLEKLTAWQLHEKLSAFYGILRLTLLPPQEPAACPSPEPDRFGLRLFNLFKQLILNRRHFCNLTL